LNAIDKLFHLLEQFTDEKPQWGVRELSLKAGLSPNLTHWYLKNLERNRVVKKDPENEKYELGYRLFELANRNSRLSAVRRVALPILKELSASTGATAILKVLDGKELLCLASVEAPSSLRVHHAEGTRVPCNYGCVGKVLMAHMDEREAEDLVRKGHIRRFTERTIMDAAALKKEWTQIRMRGWAYSSGESIKGARAVAAPVRDASGKVCAGIGVTFPAIALTKAQAKAAAATVVKAAHRLSVELGWVSLAPDKRRKVH
jgi:DNA-binding IclR family transcriptional regulator